MYKVVKKRLTPDYEIEDFLNDYYHQGFELCASYSDSDRITAFIFKLRASRPYMRQDND